MYHNASHNVRLSLKHRNVFYNSEGNIYIKNIHYLGLSFTSWARIWTDPSLWTFWLILASDTLSLVANWTRRIRRKPVGFFSNVLKIIQKSFILFLSTTNLHISHFPFLAFRTEIELLEKWTFPFLTRWFWLF